MLLRVFLSKVSALSTLYHNLLATPFFRVGTRSEMNRAPGYEPPDLLMHT